MKERPILMSAPMVRAILAGTKTQTRRALRVQPGPSCTIEDGMNGETRFVYSQLYGDGPGHEVHERRTNCPCPYGLPGDRLWVRETFFAFGRWETRYSAKKARDEWHFIDMTIECGHQYHYEVEDPTLIIGAKGRGGVTPMWWRRPAIFMPRAASRIDLDITAQRVECLQEISRFDAMAEGIVQLPDLGFGLPAGEHYHAADPRQSYFSLWEAINGPGSVQANPLLWAVSFREVKPC